MSPTPVEVLVRTQVTAGGNIWILVVKSDYPPPVRIGDLITDGETTYELLSVEHGHSPHTTSVSLLVRRKDP